MKENSQKYAILSYLKTHDYITNAIASNKFKAYRLGAVISALRKEHDIDTIMVTVKNKYGTKSTYAEYHYRGVKNGEQANVQY